MLIHKSYEDMEIGKVAHHEADQGLLVQRSLVTCKRGVKKKRIFFSPCLFDTLGIIYYI